MWISQFKFNAKNGQIGSRTLDFGVDLFGFPLSYSYETDYVIVNIAGNLFGSDKEKKLFIRSMKSAERVVNFEVNNDFFIGTIKEPSYIKPIYSSKIIHLSPVHITKKGDEVLTIGSFSRSDLIDAINSLKSFYDLEIKFIKQKNVNTISFFKQSPNLTGKQNESMKLALTNGYYSVPRKTDLVKLAKLMKCAYSTYQVHLRKAESKLMPFHYEDKK